MDVAALDGVIMVNADLNGLQVRPMRAPPSLSGAICAQGHVNTLGLACFESLVLSALAANQQAREGVYGPAVGLWER